MASRINLARVGAAVLGVSLALMVGALPASAGTTGSDSNPTDTVTAKVVGSGTEGAGVTMDIAAAEGGGKVQANGFLETLSLSDGTSTPSYCIDLTTHLNTKLSMTGGPWSTFTERDGSTFTQKSQYIQWILRNSYPAVQDLPTLAKAASITGTLSLEDAISGTQAAIWHYSDAADLEASSADANLNALYNYLTGNANVGVPEQTLTVTAAQTSGDAGKLIGPFTVNTNLTGSLTVDTTKLPTGVTVTDANGAAIDLKKLANGSKFYIDVAATATATTGSLVISGTSESGLIFVASAKSQELIAANETPLQTPVSAKWTLSSPSTGSTAPTAPAATGTTPKANGPTGQLAYTGVSATGPIVLGILLIAAGGFFLLVQRRLKRAA